MEDFDRLLARVSSSRLQKMDRKIMDHVVLMIEKKELSVEEGAALMSEILEIQLPEKECEDYRALLLILTQKLALLNAERRPQSHHDKPFKRQRLEQILTRILKRLVQSGGAVIAGGQPQAFG
ncbi:hypothetical protein EBZ80_15720 [bacterium]|nr:hypothetical protein [bacterium]